jgi:hypothetical protein
MFDLKMHQQNHYICLTLDNFSGHRITYQLTNVHIEFFEPNLTAFIQPLDAGIICCFKAHYHQGLCQHALDLNDVGKQDIYNIILLKAMLMANEAWDSISSATVEHCWNHTRIQCPPITICLPHTQQKHVDPSKAAAWTILEEFATMDMGLPEAEKALKDCLGDQYVDKEWRPALDAVMAAENDTDLVLENVKKLQLTSGLDSPTTPTSPSPLHAPTI